MSFATAATISTSATCDGVTTFGTFFASCNDGRFEAGAGLEISGTFSVSVSAGPITAPPPLNSGSASANFYDDYVFTVTGGTGAGFFFPCFSGSSDAGASAAISFGGIGGHLFNCGPNVFPDSKPFTFGVPQIITVSMFGSASPPTPRTPLAQV